MLVFTIITASLFFILAQHFHWFLAFIGENRLGASANQSRQWLRIIPYFTFLPAVVALFTSVRVQLSNHGYFHSGYILQILNNRIPPENATLPGSPANTYWLYEALLASLAHLTKLPLPFISTATNFMTLALTLLLVRQILLFLLPHLAGALRLEFLTLFSLFGINLFGFFYSFVALAGFYHRLDLGYLGPIVLYGEPRLRSLLNKYMNFNGFPIGILCYIFVLYIVICALQRQNRPADLFLALLALMGALALHVTTGLFILVIIPVALVATLFINRLLWQQPKNIAGAPPQALLWSSWQSNRMWWMVTAATILLLGIPLALFIKQSHAALQTPSTIAFWGSSHFGSILAVTYPIIPFYLVSLWHGWKQHNQSHLFLAIVSLAGLGAGYLARLPDGNEYKFIILGTIAMCLVSAPAVLTWLDVRGPGRVLPRLLAWLSFVMVCLNIIFGGLQRSEREQLGDNIYAYEGTHIIVKGDPTAAKAQDIAYADLYLWIRDNLPADTIVVIPRSSKDQSSIYVLAERLPYVVDGDIYNRAIPAYTDRIALITALYETETAGTELAAILEDIRQTLPARPLVLVYPHNRPNHTRIEQLMLPIAYRGLTADLYTLR
jgi:hypothetical protein